MNADRLLAHYEKIADAPDAIVRLRRFILDLAVRGKLVEQNPNDEPAVGIVEEDCGGEGAVGEGRRDQEGRSPPLTPVVPARATLCSSSLMGMGFFN